MSFNGLRLEYALEGSSNYITWKDRMEAVLEDNGLKEFIDSDVPKPTLTDFALPDAWQRKWKRQGGFYWKVYETTLSQAFMGNPHHILYGRL